MTIFTRGRSEEIEIEKGVGEVCMSDSKSGEKNFFIARSSIEEDQGTGGFYLELVEGQCQQLYQELWMRER